MGLYVHMSYLRVVEDGHTFIQASGLWGEAWLIGLGLELFLFLPHNKEALWLGISGWCRQRPDNLI